MRISDLSSDVCSSDLLGSVLPDARQWGIRPHRQCPDCARGVVDRAVFVCAFRPSYGLDSKHRHYFTLEPAVLQHGAESEKRPAEPAFFVDVGAGWSEPVNEQIQAKPQDVDNVPIQCRPLKFPIPFPPFKTTVKVGVKGA